MTTLKFIMDTATGEISIFKAIAIVTLILASAFLGFYIYNKVD
jgi:hypothetical protein